MGAKISVALLFGVYGLLLLQVFSVVPSPALQGFASLEEMDFLFHIYHLVVQEVLASLLAVLPGLLAVESEAFQDGPASSLVPGFLFQMVGQGDPVGVSCFCLSKELEVLKA